MSVAIATCAWSQEPRDGGQCCETGDARAVTEDSWAGGDRPDETTEDSKSETAGDGTCTAVDVLAADGAEETARDVFGIGMLFPTRKETRPWTSAHWADRTYDITARVDANDPQHISGKRGDGTLSVANGVLTMAGSEPRIYFYPYAGAPWRDVELTVYYMRVSDNGTAYAGMVAGVRSGADGHTTQVPCDAHTYYARARHDGALDFEKELKHPRSSPRARLPAAQAWPDGQLPRNQWIGFKFVSFNIGNSVKLELYRDLTGGKDGGEWIKVNETTDSGGWVASTDCPEHNPVGGASDMHVLEGGTILIRNTGATDARYRWISIREIQVP